MKTEQIHWLPEGLKNKDSQVLAPTTMLLKVKGLDCGIYIFNKDLK